MSTFTELFKKMGLSSADDKKNLNTIKRWCHQNVSEDISFEGHTEEEYNQYVAYVEHYFDNFLTHLPDNLEKKSEYYADQNAIQYAAQQGYNRFIANLSTQVLEKIINQGDLYQMTPLHKAAAQGHVHTVDALLNHGAKADTLNAQRQLPLHSALWLSMICPKKTISNKEKIVQKLLPLTPEITAADKAGNTCLHLAVTHPFDKLTDLLIEKYPKLAFIKNNASHYPIHTAILNDQVHALNRLLATEGGPLLTDSQGSLPLHYAVRYGTPEMIEACCEHTKDINQKDGSGNSPLYWAAFMGNQGAMKILLTNQANPKLTNSENESLLTIAENQGQVAMAEWIRQGLPFDSKLSGSDHINSPKNYQ